MPMEQPFTWKMKFKVFFLIFFWAYSAVYAQAVPDKASGRIIIKFADSTAFWKETSFFFQQNSSVPFQTAKTAGSPVINVFLSDASVSSLFPLGKRECFRQTDRGLERLFIAVISDTVKIQNTLDHLNSHPYVEYAEPDYAGYGGGQMLDISNAGSLFNGFPDDHQFRLQWGLKNTGQEIGGTAGIAGADINASGAWNVTTGFDSVIIAILDSGIPREHPEFSGRLRAGYDFVNDDDDPEDDHGHGTSVASIAAATGNNGRLMAGVDWNVKIMAVKILNQNNYGHYSWWINGIEYAVNNGADVINMSIGGTVFSRALQDAVNYALDNGVILVACMMNSNDDTVYYPAGFEGVISVGAINNRDERAVSFFWDKENSGSNYGDHIDFTAPGDMIISLRHDSHFLVSWWSGTSQAAPMVSGTITLMRGVNKEMGRDEIYDALKSTTRDQVRKPAGQTEWNRYYGWGRIDSGAAVNEAAHLTAVEEEGSRINLPEGYGLLQNYPNPFNASTVIQYTLSTKSHVILTVYDTAGRRRAVLVNQIQDAGMHEAAFDGSGLAGGVYLCRIQAGEFISSIKMLLLK